jgi:hypothetical protein
MSELHITIVKDHSRPHHKGNHIWHTLESLEEMAEGRRRNSRETYPSSHEVARHVCCVFDTSSWFRGCSALQGCRQGSPLQIITLQELPNDSVTSTSPFITQDTSLWPFSSTSRAAHHRAILFKAIAATKGDRAPIGGRPLFSRLRTESRLHLHPPSTLFYPAGIVSNPRRRLNKCAQRGRYMSHQRSWSYASITNTRIDPNISAMKHPSTDEMMVSCKSLYGILFLP